MQIRKNRDRIIKICATLRFLARQMSLLFIIYISSNQGNLLEILRWASENDTLIKAIFDDSTGIPPI
ncbi:unnamed protein product [Rotaria socialis]|uniref:Uncharacterized protein n=2 Tax=Rotaria socialis TaxID=392032 RepID=A0A820LVK5_9BILA|nr:unnamed protein product [Rotaria socialis]CAF3496890.1 unnamed protein product [Rotaria socialis]CAF3599358.1 unnamed protein product [Rotaria socialis]CAF3702028.1 unnamed protein product [Rotaria socialis]CAF4359528.1 unnamed protein product [Rotaria socialis]